MTSGARTWDCELSTVDSALRIAGMLVAGAYFDGADEAEREIRDLSEHLYARVAWRWALDGGLTLSHRWTPADGIVAYRWEGYDEALLLYVLAHVRHARQFREMVDVAVSLRPQPGTDRRDDRGLSVGPDLAVVARELAYRSRTACGRLHRWMARAIILHTFVTRVAQQRLHLLPFDDLSFDISGMRRDPARGADEPTVGSAFRRARASSGATSQADDISQWSHRRSDYGVRVRS